MVLDYASSCGILNLAARPLLEDVIFLEKELGAESEDGLRWLRSCWYLLGIARRGFQRPRRAFSKADSISPLVNSGPVYDERIVKHLGCPDIYDKQVLKRRKQEVLDFIRHGLFLDPATAKL